MLKKTIKNEDFITILLFSIISIAIIVFQSSRIFSLWDFTNYADLAARIFAGQVPYVDIPLYTQPGSFVDIAISYLLFGKNVQGIYFLIFAKQVLIGILLIKIINLVLKLEFKEKIFIMIMFALLNSWSIVPQPTYDADIAFTLIFSTWVLIRTYKKSTSLEFQDYFLIPMSIWFPFWYKQSSGLLWLIFSHLFFIFLSLKTKKYSILKLIIIFETILFFIIYILNNQTKIINYWILWAVQKPLETRLTQNMTPQAQLIRLLEFKNLIIISLLITIIYFVITKTILYSKIKVFFLAISIFIISVDFIRDSWNKDSYFEMNWNKLISLLIVSSFIYFFINFIFERSDINLKIINIGLIFSITANYLSQGIVGSSYAFFPLYLLIIILSSKSVYQANNLKLFKFFSIKSIYTMAVLTLTISVNFYTFSNIRMSYVRFDEPVHKYPKLYGWIGMPGEYLKESQTGIDLFEEYSKKGPTTVWPGEDPVSLFSNEIPATEVSISDPTTNPFFNDVRGWLTRNNIQFVVLKTRLQTPGQHQISIDKFVEANKDFKQIKQVGVYLVLERIN